MSRSRNISDLISITEVNSNIGISNSSPPALLTLGKEVSTYEDLIMITNYSADTDPVAAIGYDQTDDTLIIRNDQSFATGGIGFRAGGTSNHMFIKSDGKVGIGTTNPQQLLHLESNSSGETRLQFKSDNIGGSHGLFWVDENAVNQSQFYYNHTSNKQFLELNGNGLQIYSKQTSSTIAEFGSGAGGYNNFSIPNGNVGIGTTSPDRSLHVNGQVRVKSLLTDTIKQWSPTGNYTAGTSYVFSTRDEIASLGYGDGMYRFVIYTNTFNAGISHYSTFVSYDPFYFTNTGSNAPQAFTFNWSGVAMGHAPNTGTRAADLVLRHKYGTDGTYPANQTFEFIPTAGLSNLNSAGGYEFYIRLYKIG